MSTCPTEEQLAGFYLQSCKPEEAEAIAAHVAKCESCRSWCDEASSHDEMLADVRHAMDEQAQEGVESSAKTVISPSREVVGVRSRQHSGETPLVDGYTIVREIGRGGMGAVYLAVQESTKRKVALKVLLDGPLASTSAKRRFEREVELAAQLQHPNVVTILESGIHSGRYYCAMQYVEGKRLDEFVNEKSLSIDAILSVFLKICLAVHYAHQRGVIHRDLKPSNILVDETGSPHVLDFGLAKPVDAMGLIDEERTMLSMPGQLMGTLPYMSPEQTTGRHSDIDVRSDVYSLGVILYQMLTGRFPYKVVGQLAEVLRNIVNATPERPSTIQRRINDEIETIVLKALAKERERRYQSAEGLATDIERYLKGHPIEAKRDSGWYVIRKTARQYRFPLSAAAVFMIVLAGGIHSLLKQQDDHHRTRATSILSAFGGDQPALAVAELGNFGGSVREYVIAGAERMLQSPAEGERVIGARAALYVDPAPFWESVDGGLLWENGEWLELARMEWTDPAAVVAELSEKAASGTDRQKYVAFCVLGSRADANEDLIRLCRNAVANEAHPGVVAAARWAAARLGTALVAMNGETTFVDDVSQMSFVEVPGVDSYLRGASADDPEAYVDEVPPAAAVAISPFMFSETEVTVAAFAPFFEKFEAEPFFGDQARSRYSRELDATAPMTGIYRQLQTLTPQEQQHTAVSMVSPQAGRKYCEWLTEQGMTATPPRRYRLPTEEEWEFAARGGNAGRYCYGDDERYATFFAACNGVRQADHMVAQLMPNWYGLFDMHGGLWELTDSAYEKQFVLDPEHQKLELWTQRGGAYYSPAVKCRSTQRNYVALDGEGLYTGLRIIMEFVEP